MHEQCDTHTHATIPPLLGLSGAVLDVLDVIKLDVPITPAGSNVSSDPDPMLASTT